MADNETKAEITYLNNGKPESVVISKENIKNGIKSGIIRFDNISNEFDEYALMKIEPKDDLNYSAVTGYLYEFNGLVLDEKGSYDITFIDRAGQNYTLKVEILGGAELGISGIEKGDFHNYITNLIFHLLHIFCNISYMDYSCFQTYTCK